jgi:TetR/AcrR family transcriptional regulator
MDRLDGTRRAIPQDAMDRPLPPWQGLMYENFKRIPSAQQQRILEACLEEFARNGYEQASTNSIVQRAGIPKGTLFYFFGSKKHLYLYLIDYAVGLYVEQVNRNKEVLPADFFERLLARGRLRMQFALQKPLLYKFFFNAFLHTPQEIRAEMALRYGEYADSSRQLLYDGLDLSKFKDDIDVEKAIDLTNLVLEGIFSRYANQLSQGTPEHALAFVEKLTEQVREYFGLLKCGLYR